MPKNSNSQTARQALVDELDQLVHMLGNGPEFQHEIPLPHDEHNQRSFDGLERDSAANKPVPMLTSIFDTDPATGQSVQIDALIEELIEELMPRFETLLRARLKTRLKTSRK